MKSLYRPEDLDYLRTLAEAGEQSPLLAGRFYALWGLLTALAYSLHFIFVTGLIGGPGALPILWISFILIGAAGHFVLLRLLFGADLPGGGAIGNRTSQYVWRFASLVLSCLFAGLILKASLSGDPGLMNWSIPFVLATYSLAMGVTGSLADNKIIRRAAYASAASVGLTTLMIDSPYVYLLASVIMLLVAALPGFLLLRDEPRSIV